MGDVHVLSKSVDKWALISHWLQFIFLRKQDAMIPQALRKTVRNTPSICLKKTVAALLVFVSLALLSGCMGVSSSSSTPRFGNLNLNNSLLNFGSVNSGSSKTLTVTAVNAGNMSVTISAATFSTNNFSLASTLPTTLASGQSANLSVKFTPNAAGTFTGAATLTSDAVDATTTLTLSGTGVSGGSGGQLAPGAATENFGGVIVGSIQTLVEILTNTGGTSVTISQTAITGTGFSLSGITAPVTLSAGQSANLSVSFAPQSAGSATGNITITSNAPNPTLTIPLSGTGLAAGELTSNPSSEAFGSIAVGSKQTWSGTITNTGGTSVTISQAAISGAAYTLSGISAPITLNAGQSTNFSVVFAPQAAGSATGNITITSNAPNPTLTIPLSGTGVTPGQLTSNPTSEGFGTVTVGSKQSLSETVTNTGGTSVTISQVAVSGTGYSITGITAPVTLGVGQSVGFNVSFAPPAAGSVSGNVTITSNASNPSLTVPLTGSGAASAGQLSVTPTTLGLGSVVVGLSGTASGGLTATGANVTVTGASSNNSVFSIGGLSLPVTIPAGQSAPFTVTFSPQASGSASASLSFSSNAQPATTIEALTGTGTPAPAHTVSLSWNASTSSSISGYNVYRATYTSWCGSFGKINSTLNTSTLYTDSAVVDGTSYCYATTAVNTSNQESGYSNIVTNIQIPAP
jgi:Abnormal spindle-like microcephaly-assoc'd, ASPM-SPD-2-Hydin/Protein of unknown function (DUF1573)